MDDLVIIHVGINPKMLIIFERKIELLKNKNKNSNSNSNWLITTGYQPVI
jgi:hypothetical protein